MKASPSLLRRLSRLTGRLALIAGATTVALLIMELGIRVFAPQQLVLLRRDIWEPAEGLGWRQAPGLDTRVNTGEGEVRLLTDERGHRIGSERQSEPAEHRVLILGDSFLASLQVEYEESIAGLLERSLEDELEAGVSVVNTAVAGYGPSQYLLKTRAELTRQAYDLALVFLFVGNDIEEERQEIFRPRESRRRPLRWPRALSGEELVDAWAYPVNNFLEARSHLFVLAKNRLWSLLMGAGLTARRFPEVLLETEARSSRWEVTASTCSEIAAVAAQHGAESYFVLVPGAYQVDERLARSYARALRIDWGSVRLDQPSELLVPALERRGLEVLDALPSLRQRWAAGAERLYGTVDTHLSAAGHAVIAGLVHPAAVSLLRRSGRRTTVTTDER